MHKFLKFFAVVLVMLFATSVQAVVVDYASPVLSGEPALYFSNPMPERSRFLGFLIGILFFPFGFVYLYVDDSSGFWMHILYLIIGVVLLVFSVLIPDESYILFPLGMVFLVTDALFELALIYRIIAGREPMPERKTRRDRRRKEQNETSDNILLNIK